MKNARLLAWLVPLMAAGCATSLAPSENFNDWTNSAMSRYPEPRTSGTPSQTAGETRTAPISLSKAPVQQVHP